MPMTETPTAVLITADWAVDPHAVVAAAAERAEAGPAEFLLVVPAWLHGLDWAGDPRASAPCAHAQVRRIAELCAAAGLAVAAARVGDPDPVTAISDLLGDRHADELLLCTRRRGLLAYRARRATGLPVRHVEARGPAAGRRRGHCVPAAA